jgi:hypothetical protein
MRRLAIAALAPALAATAPAVPALAQSGVHVDPGSPAGKEYALPLDQARRDAGGGGGRQSGQPGSSSSGSAALFGQGIKPVRSAGGKAKGSAPGSDAQGSGKSGSRSGAAARLSATTGTTGGSPLLVDGGIALAVLLAAGAFALGLRRVLR